VTATLDNGVFNAPRDFTRDADFEIIRADSDGDGLTFEGYAAVFNSPTVIDSWEGHFEETIKRGAFAKTLRERTPVLMFEHGKHPLIGAMPLGVIQRATEDARGLFIRARLHDNWLIEPVRDAVREGSVTGMSFRFTMHKDSWEQRQGDIPRRTLLELGLPELGPVVFPAYSGTTASVRSALAALVSDDELRSGLMAVLPSTSNAAAPPSTPEEAAPAVQPADATDRTANQRRRDALVAMAQLQGVLK